MPKSAQTPSFLAGMGIYDKTMQVFSKETIPYQYKVNSASFIQKHPFLTKLSAFFSRLKYT